MSSREFVRAGAGGLALAAAPSRWFQPDVSAADAPEQIGFGRTVPAETRTYVDGAASGVEVFRRHAVVRGLRPDAA
jgi:hypothetical protein